MADSLAPPSLRVNTHLRRSSRSSDQDDSTTIAETPTSLSFSSTPALSTATLASTTPRTSGRPEDVLRPDPGTEADFNVENNPYAFSPGQLNKLLNPKSLDALLALGGIKGLEKGLQTNIDSGLSTDETSAGSQITFNEAIQSSKDPSKSSNQNIASNPSSSSNNTPFADRIRVFGKNVLPAKKATPLWKLMWNAYNDKVLILLTVAAFISLALGLYETFGVEHEPGAPQPVDWIEGVAICVAIVIVVTVGSLNDWQKERAFVRLNAKKDDREAKVIRSGKAHIINVHDILVGDILHLEPGDLIPVDGVLIQGQDVKCDESSATGESDAIKKVSVHTALEHPQTMGRGKDPDPFVISGAKVLEGVGTFLCTSVGEHSSFGKIMMSVRTEMDSTPLQKKLEGLAGAIAKLGGSAAFLLLFVLTMRFVAQLSGDDRSPAEKASTFMDILIVAITVIVVAVPEGLPLAVTLALAFATTRLLKENNLVRVLHACETMGNATTVCSDKTGTLTTNKMTVVAGTFGDKTFSQVDDKSLAFTDAANFARDLPEQTKRLVIQSVAINSTAFESEDLEFIGSKTETALLQFAREHLGMQPLSEVRANEEVVQLMPFNSSMKCMAAVVKLPSGKGYRLLVKGASEILLTHCTEKLAVQDQTVSAISDSDRRDLSARIDLYARKSLRTIGLVYRDYSQWPPAGIEAEDGHVKLENVLGNLVFLGVVGIQDPVRPGVPEAVRKAQQAGVVVRMVTGDNAVTARAIATECGIYTDGVIMEGPDFRVLTDEKMAETLPRLQVLARSSPEDKRILVVKLKQMGETVAVTGDGTNDAPALKTADVGFSMGIAGTEVAREASAIVLMDDNFTGIVTAIKWGRAVNDSVQKFLQFQITVNITAVLLTFISAVSNPDMKSVLTAVQLLWVNLIMDTFAALALATDPPTERILERPPQPKRAPLVTLNMWKMITGQAIFQLAVTLVLYFAGSHFLPFDSNGEKKQLELDTIVFNTFVWMQIFNEFNNRRLDNKFNIFEGIQRNAFFIVINCIIVGAQIAIVFVGGRAFSITAIDGKQWAICVGVAAVTIPFGVLVRLFPDAWFAAVAKVACVPVVPVYRGVKTAFRALGNVFRRNKETNDETSNGEEKGEGSTSTDSTPTILVTRQV